MKKFKIGNLWGQTLSDEFPEWIGDRPPLRGEISLRLGPFALNLFLRGGLQML